MTAAGQTTWFEFAKAILEEATRAPRNLSWLASATKGRPIITRCVLPLSAEAFASPTRRPAYSVLSNARLKQVFGVTLPDWRTQLQRCFSLEQVPANPSATFSSR
jgi:dTDP-4-dehydrorhamnose reductase